MTDSKGKRVRPTLKRQRELEQENAALREKLTAAEGADDGELGVRVKDQAAVIKEQADMIRQLQEQLADALEGRDHTQGADLPPVQEGKERFFNDLTGLHAERLGPPGVVSDYRQLHWYQPDGPAGSRKRHGWDYHSGRRRTHLRRGRDGRPA